MLYHLYRIARFLAITLPVGFSYRIADISGSLYYLLANKDRKIVNDNIEVILKYNNDKRAVGRLSREVFTNFARYLVEFFRASKIDLKYIEKYIDIQGRENLDKALSSGKGVLLVSAHLGNWELGAMALSILGYPLNVVAWTHRDRKVNEFFLGQRQSKGVKIIPLGVAIRRVLFALKNNEAVAFLGDIDYANPEIGVTVKLFGQDTIMPKGPAVFSLKTDCPIVPVFVVREKGNRFKFIIEEAISYKPTDNYEYDVANLTQSLSKRLEFHISRNPGQWFMLTPRWPA
ncbi:MAG: lysophospholipid acyltransferase family protein [Candidatus Omnitrophota bacterium]|nr:MAG: lysophospholipid acyltransferase family protein [Candidatus Omnitrophota bacterium]